jgi:tetratricopeptide (TPR) repeat protein
MNTKNYTTYLCVLILSLCLVEFTLAQNTAEEWFQKGTQATSPADKIQYYLKSIELDSTLVEAHYNLAYVYKSKEDYTKALTAFEKALNLGLKKKDDKLNLSIFY